MLAIVQYAQGRRDYNGNDRYANVNTYCILEETLKNRVSYDETYTLHSYMTQYMRQVKMD